MVKPISPNEVRKILPDIVIETFNNLIQRHWKGTYATFTQKEAAVALAHAMNVETSYLYANNLLDVEDVYRAEGWDVVYDQPVAYAGESYDARFTFSKLV